MTDERFQAILAKQIPDAEKRARADFVVETGTGLEDAREQVAQIVRIMRDPARRPKSRRG
jgi:dephospho-CoA kinase